MHTAGYTQQVSIAIRVHGGYTVNHKTADVRANHWWLVKTNGANTLPQPSRTRWCTYSHVRYVILFALYIVPQYKSRFYQSILLIFSSTMDLFYLCIQWVHTHTHIHFRHTMFVSYVSYCSYAVSPHMSAYPHSDSCIAISPARSGVPPEFSVGIWYTVSTVFLSFRSPWSRTSSVSWAWFR